MEIKMTDIQKLAWLTMNLLENIPPFMPNIGQHLSLMSRILGKDIMALRSSKSPDQAKALNDQALELVKQAGMIVNGDEGDEEMPPLDTDEPNPVAKLFGNPGSIPPEGHIIVIGKPGGLNQPPKMPNLPTLLKLLAGMSGGMFGSPPEVDFNRGDDEGMLDPDKQPMSKADRFLLRHDGERPGSQN